MTNGRHASADPSMPALIAQAHRSATRNRTMLAVDACEGRARRVQTHNTRAPWDRKDPEHARASAETNLCHIRLGSSNGTRPQAARKIPRPCDASSMVWLNCLLLFPSDSSGTSAKGEIASKGIPGSTQLADLAHNNTPGRCCAILFRFVFRHQSLAWPD